MRHSLLLKQQQVCGTGSCGLLLQVDLPFGRRVVIGHSSNGESAPVHLIFDSEDGRNVIVNGRPYRETYGSISGQIPLGDGVTSTRVSVVEVLPDGSRRNSPFRTAAKIDEDGTFKVKGLPHGEHTLLAKVQRGNARADFYQTRFTIDQWEQQLDELVPGPCSMRLIGPPFAGSGFEPFDGRSFWCKVTLHWWGPGARVDLWLPFDGEVQLTGLQPGEYRLSGEVFYRQFEGRMHASRNGRMSSVGGILLEPAEELRVELSAGT